MVKNKRELIRGVGLPGAVMMGMGSIVGTGVFVSLGLAAGVTGPAMVFSLFLAGLLAVCNGLSTAQLASDHPMSGGTYEYGYKYLNEMSGYLAGWLFVCAKSASAATAAIGFGGYFIRLFSLDDVASWQVGLIVTSLVIFISALGIKRSSIANIMIVSVTLTSLVVYVLVVLPHLDISNFTPLFENQVNSNSAWPSFLEASALMFVAYTGYGRVATLGEEIEDPVKNIPRAIIITLGFSFIIYLSVAIVSIGAVGSEVFYSGTINDSAPLRMISDRVGHPMVGVVLSFGAMTAMLGVLLNLVLGLSRVFLAMGRKRDLPSLFSHIDTRHVPVPAILGSGIVILGLILLKDIKLAWSFSALTVLMYYSITNISALYLPKEKRLYPRLFAWLGLFGCLSLALWVEAQSFLMAGVILLIGIGWRVVYRMFQRY